MNTFLWKYVIPISLILITIGLMVLAFDYMIPPEHRMINPQPAPPPEPINVNDYVRVLDLDGHKFILSKSSGGMMHHPGCQCLNKNQ